MKHGVECWLSPSPAPPAWHGLCGGRTLPQPCAIGLCYGPALANGMWGEVTVCLSPRLSLRTPLMFLLVPPVLLPPLWKECVKRQLLAHEEQRKGSSACTWGPALIPPCPERPCRGWKATCCFTTLRFEGCWFHSIIIANAHQAWLNCHLQTAKPRNLS